MEDLTGLRPRGGPYGASHCSQFCNFPSPRRLVNDYCALHTTRRCGAASLCPPTPFSRFIGRIGTEADAKPERSVNARHGQSFPRCRSKSAASSLEPRLGGWRELFLDAAIDIRGERVKFAGDFDRINRRRHDRAQRFGHAFELFLRSPPDGVERRRGLYPPAAAHHEFEERLAVVTIAFASDNIAGHPAVSAVAPPHLLSSRPGGFVFRALPSRPAGIFLKLVDAIECRHVR